jgi:hypothetical protein
MPTSFSAEASRVAIVDAYSTGRILQAALHRHGTECVHVQSPSPDVHMARLPFPEGLADSIRYDGDLVATASALREHGVGWVIAGGEPGLELADQLSAELGTPGNGMSRPTSRRNDLAEQRGIAYQTVRRTMRELRERGLVARVVGKGTFVIATRSSRNPES